jgi:hypothetical protein
MPKKTWKPVRWEDIRAGDVVRWLNPLIDDVLSSEITVEHIGDRFFKDTNSTVLTSTWKRYRFGNVEYQYQRLETEYPDKGVYVLKGKCSKRIFVGTKLGDDIYEGYNARFRGGINDFEVLETIWEEK